jgi:hypothetical protein
MEVFMRLLSVMLLAVTAACNIYIVEEKTDSGSGDDTATNVDSDNTVHESGWNDSGNGVDSGSEDNDGDGDGYTEAQGDCDDSNDAVYPGAEEVCDDLDNDCDHETDEDAVDASTWYPDSDGDGYGDDDSGTESCDQPKGMIATGGDCDDDDEAVNPDAEEISCDEIDQDCDGANQGGVWFEDEKGAITDLTATFSAGTSTAPANHVVQDDGTLTFCDGVWNASLEINTSVATLTSVNGVDATTISTSGEGPVVTVSAASAYLTVDGLTLANGSSDWGGCIASQEPDVAVEIHDSLLYACAATEAGGSIYIDSGSLLRERRCHRGWLVDFGLWRLQWRWRHLYLHR